MKVIIADPQFSSKRKQAIKDRYERPLRDRLIFVFFVHQTVSDLAGLNSKCISRLKLKRVILVRAEAEREL